MSDRERALRLQILRLGRTAFPDGLDPLFDLLDSDDPRIAEKAAAFLWSLFPSPDEMLRQLDALDEVDADLARILADRRRKTPT